MRLINLEGDITVTRHQLQPFVSQPAGIGHRSAHEDGILHLAIAVRLDDAARIAKVSVGQSRLFVR